MLLCCVCLYKNSEAIGIFDDIHVQLNIAEIIDKHFWFKVMKMDATNCKLYSKLIIHFIKAYSR